MFKKLVAAFSFFFVLLFLSSHIHANAAVNHLEAMNDGGSGPTYTYTKTETWDEWKLFPFNKHYSKVEYYKRDYTVYRIYLKNISGTTYWDGGRYSATGVVEISRTEKVSSTNAWQVSGDLGFKVPVKAAEVSGKLGGSYSKSKTYTTSDNQRHARTLDRQSPPGYYSLQAAINADEYKVYVYDRANTRSSWSSQGYGYMLRYHTEDPYVYLRYTTYSH